MSAILSVCANDLMVGYSRKQTALCIPRLDLQGGCIALLGHNGSGKSTLLKSILGLLPSSSGEIKTSIVGEGSDLSPQTDMAFCPEAGSVFLDVTVDEYLAFWSRIRLGDSKAYRSIANQAILSELGILPHIKRLGRELSKGQRRRVHAAVGFLIKPKLFLFDEPFDGLDIRHASALVSCIERFKSTTAFIISSHRVDIVERLCDAAIVLQSGRIITSGDLSTVTKALGGTTLSAGMIG